jgi:hypothetical protein
MSYVTIDEFQKFTNIIEGVNSLQQSYIDAAENIVEDYLGYSPVLNYYIHTFNGSNTNILQLKAKPIRAIQKVSINGIEYDGERFTNYDDEFIYYNDGIFNLGIKNIIVTYIAGWADIQSNPDNDDNIDGGFADDNENIFYDGGNASSFIGDNSDMPKIIRLTVLRIAALLQSESDQNIGVTSKSFAESGTRTFVNTVNFEKYLNQISKFSLLRF